jgi:hypothetical protein
MPRVGAIIFYQKSEGPSGDTGYRRDFLRTQSVSLSGAKRTCPFALHMSAFDPKRTCAAQVLCDANGPLNPVSLVEIF